LRHSREASQGVRRVRVVKTNFYVDAFNLYYGSLKGIPDRWLDLDALFRAVFPKNQINRIRYFTAIVESPSTNWA
jgi:hypothetical protein